MHTFNLSTIVKPAEIQQYFRKNKIKAYAYEYIFGRHVLKYGRSSKSWKETALGERVCRQAQNIPLGWPGKINNRSSSGKDFRDICDDFENVHGIKVDKNQVSLIVYDVTNYPCISIRDPESYAKEMEAELIQDYVNINGVRPIGNLKDETCNIPSVDDDAWKSAGFDV